MAEKFDHIADADDVRDHAAHVRRRRLHVGDDASAGAAKLRAVQSDFLYDRRLSQRSYTGESYLPPAFSVAMIALLAAVALGAILRDDGVGYKLRT